MPLASYVPRKRKVEFDGGDVEVRAINLQDVAILLDAHQYSIDRIAVMIRSRRPTVGADGEPLADPINEQIVIDTIMEVVRESPLLAANIIAVCADETEFQDAAAKLPLPVQIEVLKAISEVTFKDEAALKKFAADVMMLIRGMMLPPAMEAAA